VEVRSVHVHDVDALALQHAGNRAAARLVCRADRGVVEWPGTGSGTSVPAQVESPRAITIDR
jgi:hypothetical protein